jgi:hypothetical protein
MRLVNFATANNMVISSTFFRHKDIHNATWCAPGDVSRKSQIDHVLIERRHASNILDVRSFRCLEPGVEHHDTDHLLLGARIRARISNVAKERGTRAKRFDIAKLGNKECKEVFNRDLAERIESCDNEINAWNQWFDEECEAAVQRVIDARKGRITRGQIEEVRRLQR